MAGRIDNEAGIKYFSLFNGKILVTLILATLLIGCGTTAYNIKSAGELSGNKMLTGRFVFYNDDVHIGNSEVFAVFFKKREDKTLRMFQPDEKGYVFIPVDEVVVFTEEVETPFR